MKQNETGMFRRYSRRLATNIAAAAFIELFAEDDQPKQ